MHTMFLQRKPVIQLVDTAAHLCAAIFLRRKSGMDI